MGRDKALLDVGGVPLARLAANALCEVADPAVEVGPGWSGLPSVVEEPPGSGPLAAVVTGWVDAVRRAGEKRPALVLACDMPGVTKSLLGWLASYPGSSSQPVDPDSSVSVVSVVPVVHGIRQPLCARWSVVDLERAEVLLAGGERSLKNVFGADAFFPSEQTWGEVASAADFDDLDCYADLVAKGLAPPRWEAL
jgi:molybdopterin-guanine dinucleotide biosynthesis protein A